MYSVSKWPQTPSLGETMRQAHGGETSRLFFLCPTIAGRHTRVKEYLARECIRNRILLC